MYKEKETGEKENDVQRERERKVHLNRFVTIKHGRHRVADHERKKLGRVKEKKIVKKHSLPCLSDN
jgi:hypothetical protein